MTDTPATMDLSDVRRHHLSVVLRSLIDDGPRSRAALAQETGLTKGTVSSLVAELLDRQLVEELETPKAGRVGRPATDVSASGRSVGALGLSIDVDAVAAAVVDLTGTVRARRRVEVDNSDAPSDHIVDRLRTVTAEVLVDAADQGIRSAGGALAVPGLVDAETGTLFVAPNLHWFDANLAAAVATLGLPDELPFTYDNEANLGALAELRGGAGQGLSSFVHVSGGRGIGAGIVAGGQLVRGSHGFAGELGHLVVDPGGRTCTCGARGCLETVAGIRSDADDETVADALAVALRSVVHLIDPQAIVLGGTFAERGAGFATSVQDRLAASTLGARWSPCTVTPSELGGNAGLIGAATVALDAVITDPTLVAPDPATLTA